MELKITKIDSNQEVKIPHYATKHSVGMDLSANIEETVIIPAGEVKIIPTGIAIGLVDGFEAQIRPRSGLAAKHGITVLNTPGTIDSDYRGEIKVIMINHGNKPFVVEKNMRIAQMVVAKYERATLVEVASLEETERGEGRFGSTGL